MLLNLLESPLMTEAYESRWVNKPINDASLISTGVGRAK